MELNPFELEKSLELENKDEGQLYIGSLYSYGELVNSISDKVDWTIEAGYQDYQGDSYYFGVDKSGNGSVYFLVSGYGSCSGCDALEGCDSFKDIIELRDDLKRDIRKFDNVNEFVKWFYDNQELNFWLQEDIEDFIKKFKEKYHIPISYKEKNK